MTSHQIIDTGGSNRALIHQSLEQNAALYSSKPAVLCKHTFVTYAELDSAANLIAHTLVEAGLPRGQRVGIYLPNSIEMAEAVFGVLKAGGVFVPINRETKPSKLAYILADCGAVALITGKAGYRAVQRNLENLPSLTTLISTEALPDPPQHLSYTTFEEILRRSEVDPPAAGICDQDLACIIYTSGSTGIRKGVVCGHSNVAFAADAIISYLENTPDDRVINVLPFSFDYGLYQLLMTVRFGGTLVVASGFICVAAVLRTIERYKVTGFPLIPSLASMLLKDNLEGYDLSSLRYVTSTAAALPPSHLQQLQALLPHVRIFSMYGMTECKRTLYLPPDRIRDKPRSVGIPIPGTEVWVEGLDGNKCGPGEVGELVVRGSHVMRGYWNDRELTEKYIRAGPSSGERLLYSNDLFRIDEDGFYYFVARRDDIIKSRGGKVAPKEVEAVLCEHPQVIEAAVVGVPDPALGSAIVAVVVSGAASPSEHELWRHCADRLESHMVPHRILFTDALPRTSNGKIDKHTLSMMDILPTMVPAAAEAAQNNESATRKPAAERRLSA